MLDRIPNNEELISLLGQPLYNVWEELCMAIDEKYEMECIWNSGGKKWTYEYKYRRGGKTLCAIYAKENCVGFMIIFGKKEREKFEENRKNYLDEIRNVYDEAQTYHDGKWIMFEPVDTSMFGDFMSLLEIKRKPNRKQADDTTKKCPCKRTKCERYGNCIECREYHNTVNKKRLPACECKK